jgi:hypothetical protein
MRSKDSIPESSTGLGDSPDRDLRKFPRKQVVFRKGQSSRFVWVLSSLSGNGFIALPKYFTFGSSLELGLEFQYRTVADKRIGQSLILASDNVLPDSHWYRPLKIRVCPIAAYQVMRYLSFDYQATGLRCRSGAR